MVTSHGIQDEWTIQKEGMSDKNSIDVLMIIINYVMAVIYGEDIM